MSINIIIAIIIIHWIADFVDQSEREATEKSRNPTMLTAHIIGYTVVWMFAISVYELFNKHSDTKLFLFIPITFVCHWLTDYFTSKVNTGLAIEAKRTTKWHDFFVNVGFDQMLHYIQLFLTYYYLAEK